MKIKRVLMFVLAISLLMPLFIGAEGKKPAAAVEMEPLTLLTMKPWSKEISEDNLYYKTLQEKTGVKLKLARLDASGQAEQINTMIAAGDLPDIMACPANIANSYGPQGAFLALNEYFDKAPNLKKNYSIDKVPWSYNGADGNLYSIPTSACPYLEWGWMYRGDWGDRLGIAPPKTTDDWLAAWRKVKADDSESIPVIAQPGGGAHRHLRILWGIGNSNPVEYTFHDGVLSYKNSGERVKSYITFMNTLYKEKLIWQDFLTGNREMMRTEIAKGKCFTVFDYQSESFKEVYSDEIKDGWREIAPPTGPYGDTGVFWLGVNSWWNIAVPSKCSNIDAAIKLLDYMSSEEGVQLFSFGVEGVTYKVNADGTLDFLEEIKKGAKDSNQSMLNYLVEKYNIFSVPLGPGTIPNAKDQLMMYLAQGVHPNLLKTYAMAALNICPINPPVWNTDKEIERLNELSANLSTYSDEWLAKFIVGDEPLTKWNEYEAGLKDLGVDEYNQIANKGYAKYLEFVGKEKGYTPAIQLDIAAIKKIGGIK